MERVILHSDLNNFYATVECRKDPSLKGRRVAVCGDTGQRHGIVLAKNEDAKRLGVRTGMAVWEAMRLCPDLVIIPPHMEEYVAVSRQVRKIYYRYTDLVEPFGIDECWLDVTGSVGLFGDGPAMADRIREEVKKEVGVTVSVGVSFNKVFAKLGSDYKKPDAVTVFPKKDFKSRIWPLPVGDLLFVGPATVRALRGLGIETIGALAAAPFHVIQGRLGKHGEMIWRYANGLDQAPVLPFGESCPVKSIGNSTTTPRDLENNDEVKRMLFTLSETVASRLRASHLRASVVEIWVRDNALSSFVRQSSLEAPSCLTETIAGAAFRLFLQHYAWQRPIRSIGVRVAGVEPMDAQRQACLWWDEDRRQRFEALDFSIDDLRQRYGFRAVLRGIELCHDDLPILSPEERRIEAAGMYEIHAKRG